MKTRRVIGIDEAGLGPNLGPLALAAVVWRVPAEWAVEEVPAKLEPIFARAGEPFAWRDSKAVHQGTDPFGKLERALAGVRRLIAPSAVTLGDSAAAVGLGPIPEPSFGWNAALAEAAEIASPPAERARTNRGAASKKAVGSSQDSSERTPARFGAAGADDSQAISNHARTIPDAVRAEGVKLSTGVPSTARGRAGATAEALAEGLRGSGIEWLGVRVRLIFPAEFNAALATGANKSDCLTRWCFELLRTAGMLGAVAGEETEILCDRHGGRARYAGALGRDFPERDVEILAESPALSRYRLSAAPTAAAGKNPRPGGLLFEVGPPATAAADPFGGDWTAAFAVGGERFVPTAVASLFAKYFRERAMKAFNAFWQARLPGLTPTAGYPVDARRFREAIAPVVAAEGFAWETIRRDR